MTTKKEFLEKLDWISGDKELVNYYDELISDRIEAGEEEDTVVASLDVRKILRESEFESAKKELAQKSKSRRGNGAVIVLLALFSAPITIPLAFAFLMVTFAFVITGLALVGGAVAGVVFGVMGIVDSIRIGESAELIILQFGIVLVVMAVLGFIGLMLSKLLVRFYRWMIVRFFMAFRRKEAK